MLLIRTEIEGTEGVQTRGRTCQIYRAVRVVSVVTLHKAGLQYGEGVKVLNNSVLICLLFSRIGIWK